jgi:hypothetical protein
MASQVSFGAPYAIRKESFDRQSDVKTAENTNQKDCPAGEARAPKSKPVLYDMRKPMPHLAPVQILSQATVHRSPPTAYRSLKNALQQMLGGDLFAHGAPGSHGPGFQLLHARGRLNSQK